MAEKEIIFPDEKISYTGLVKASDVYKTIVDWAGKKDYEAKDLKQVEVAKQEGKNFELEAELSKSVTDYAKYVIKVKIKARGLKDVELAHDGSKTLMSQGTVEITIRGTLETDYEGRWETKPMYYFLRTLINKYVIESETKKLQNGLKEDCSQIKNEIKGLLNLYRHRA